MCTTVLGLEVSDRINWNQDGNQSIKKRNDLRHVNRTLTLVETISLCTCLRKTPATRTQFAKSSGPFGGSYNGLEAAQEVQWQETGRLNTHLSCEKCTAPSTFRIISLYLPPGCFCLETPSWGELPSTVGDLRIAHKRFFPLCSPLARRQHFPLGIVFLGRLGPSGALQGIAYLASVLPHY